jgi:hypothetical protein
MPRLIPLLLAMAVTLLVAGCQLALPGGGAAAGDDGVTPNAVAGDPIEVTALDAPPAAPGADAAVSDVPVQDAALAAAGDSTAQPQGADPAQPAPDGAPNPAPVPETAAEAAATEPPPPQKSERQLACEKDGGTWAGTGTSSLRTCVLRTRDGGKQCNRKSQCDGQCLARSGTCSPLEPLLGCNDVLQDNGARVTLCIE